MRKKEVVVMLLVVSTLALGGCGSEYQEAYDEMQADVDKQAAEMQEEIDSQTDAILNGSTSAPADESPAPEKETETQEVSEDATEASASDSAPSSGSYEVDGISITYYSKVRNDSTGNWRLAVIHDGSDLKDYVVDFYNEFVVDDAEVFGIVNLGKQTTARVSRVMPDTLDVSVMEYVDGEEHDANVLFSGMEMDHFWINTETGEVDPLDENE